MVNTKIIADLPIELGIKRTYKGYFFLIAALELAITDQKNLLYMSKSIFPVIAARYGTTYSCIERNIRTAINACWNSPNREKLLTMSPYPLQKAPSVTAFIDFLYCFPILNFIDFCSLLFLFFQMSYFYFALFLVS